MIPPIPLGTSSINGSSPPSPRPTLIDVVDRASVLLKEKGVASHRLDARLITAFALGLSEIGVTLHADRPITQREQEKIVTLVGRRAAGIPTAYIVGTKEFWSQTLIVDERVLIPRPETELLVAEAITAARALKRGNVRIVEIGTGSGAVALALWMELPGSAIVSTDISPDAVSVAAANFSAHGAQHRIELRSGDLYGAFSPEEVFDVIVMNPPYLTTRELLNASPEIKNEPRAALFGGEDGLSVIRRLIAGAPAHLSPGGYLITEIGSRQHEAVHTVVKETPELIFSHISFDLAGHPRAAVARKTSSEVL